MPKPLHPELAAVLSEIELSFFQRGETEVPAPVETFDDLDEGYRPAGFFARAVRPLRPATEQPAEENAQWDHAIAIARTATGG
jgi:hypothetical protein